MVFVEADSVGDGRPLGIERGIAVDGEGCASGVCSAATVGLGVPSGKGVASAGQVAGVAKDSDGLA